MGIPQWEAPKNHGTTKLNGDPDTCHHALVWQKNAPRDKQYEVYCGRCAAKLIESRLNEIKVIATYHRYNWAGIPVMAAKELDSKLYEKVSSSLKVYLTN